MGDLRPGELCSSTIPAADASTFERGPEQVMTSAAHSASASPIAQTRRWQRPVPGGDRPSFHEAFAERVLDVVHSIPSGCVMTYGDIAIVLGSRSARRVGQVIARYGSDVPWWRVVRAGGYPPLCHKGGAREHYGTEGTPLTRTTPDAAYHVDLRHARWCPAS